MTKRTQETKRQSDSRERGMGRTQDRQVGGKQPEGKSEFEKKNIKSNRVKMKEFRKETFKCVEGHELRVHCGLLISLYHYSLDSLPTEMNPNTGPVL